MPDAEQEQHREREFADDLLPPSEEQERHDVHRHQQEIAEVEEREPFRRGRVHVAVPGHGRLDFEHREVELVQLLIERGRVHERQDVLQEEVADLDHAVDTQAVDQRGAPAALEQATAHQHDAEQERGHQPAGAEQASAALGRARSGEHRAVQKQHEAEHRKIVNCGLAQSPLPPGLVGDGAGSC